MAKVVKNTAAAAAATALKIIGKDAIAFWACLALDAIATS